MQRGLAPDVSEMVLETLGDVLARALPPEKILDLDDREAFPEDVLRLLLSPEVGMHLVFLPEEVGGLGGGARDVVHLSEAMAAVDLGVATAFLGINLGLDPILVGGTEEQRRLWLSRAAEEGLIVAYAVTEPEAGSNVAALRTSAEPVTGPGGEVTAYRLDGTKQFITNGGVAHLYTVLARAPGGPSFFAVERGAAGLSVGREEDKHGIRASNTTSVTLEGVEVPAAHLIGGVEGEGLKQAAAVFGYTRLMVGAFGLGGGQGALDRALRYGGERVQFGSPLLEKQGYMLKLLVPRYVDLCAGRAYVEEIAQRIDAGESGLDTEGAIAKYWCTEAGIRAADAALQAHGGYGYMREYMVEKFRRDVRITTIYEGTSEILQSIVGMFRWKAHVRSKGAFYGAMAEGMEALHAGGGDVGGGSAAESFRGLAALFEHCHRQRLTRNQIVLYHLADLATRTEVAGALSRKAARLASEEHPDGVAYAAMARVFARETAEAVVTGGRLAAAGFDAPGHEGDREGARALVAGLESGRDPLALAGHWSDMERVAARLREGPLR